MPGCQASFHSGWGTPRGEISDPSVPLKCPPGARAPPASLCRLPPAGAALTNSLLLLYKLSSRWQRPSLGVRMAPSFPSPAKWKPSSVANTSSLVTLRQPISSCGGERPGFPGVPAAGGAEAELGVAAWAVCPPLLRLPGSRGPEQGPAVRLKVPCAAQIPAAQGGRTAGWAPAGRWDSTSQAQRQKALQGEGSVGCTAT